MTPRRIAVGLVFGASFALAGCATAAPSDDSRSETTTGPVNEATLDESESGRTPIPPREVSPFDEYRNLLWGMGADEESIRRQFDADRVREEDLIAQCMNELGFDYIPFVDNITLISLNADNWRPDDPDWVAEFGYGWVIAPPGGRGAGKVGISMDAGNPDNPNNPMLAELSESERSAWRNAFSNMGAGFEREVEGVIYRDCNNWARAVVSAEHRAFANLDEFAPLREAIAQMHETLRWTITDADRAWSTCMADAGFPGFDQQAQASDSIMQEWAETTSAISQAADWDQGEPTAANSPELAELHQREVALATADLNCRISTDYADGQQAAIHAIENQFIADHRTDLAALRAAAEQHD